MKLPTTRKRAKTYVPDNKTYLKPHKAALATPEYGPQEKQFLKGISESTTNWHKSKKAAKVVIASRVKGSHIEVYYRMEFSKHDFQFNYDTKCRVYVAIMHHSGLSYKMF